MTYPDAYIEHMGEVFTANPMLRQVCTFEQFLRWPDHCARAAAHAHAVAAAVMSVRRLREQLEVQQRLDAARRQA
jgi:hypothetical protein